MIERARAALTECNTESLPPPKPPPVSPPARSLPARARQSDSPAEESRGREQRSSRPKGFLPSQSRRPEQRARSPFGDGHRARPTKQSSSAERHQPAPRAAPKTHTAFPLAVIVQVLLEYDAQPIPPRTPLPETRRSKDPAPQNLRDPRPSPPPPESCSLRRSAKNPRPFPA